MWSRIAGSWDTNAGYNAVVQVYGCAEVIAAMPWFESDGSGTLEVRLSTDASFSFIAVGLDQPT